MTLRRVSAFVLAAMLVWAAASDATGAGATATTVAAPSNVVAQRPAKSTLLVLGDSLTWGSNYFSKAQSRLATSGAFDNVVVDGWWSRRIGGIISTTYSGTNTYKKLVAGGLRPSAVIVALGTNDVYFLSRRREYATLIRELMTTIGNVPVVWVNVHRVDTPTNVNRSRLFNTTLERTLAEYPLASVFDWSSVARTDPKVMAWDRIHHSAYGYEVRTRTYLTLATSLAQQAVDMTTTTTIAPTTVPVTTAPVTTVPTATVPTATVPTATVPVTTVPATTVAP